MSKQSDAKRTQGYRTTSATCSNCTNYKSEMVEKTYESFGRTQVWFEEKNIRCGIGGFAIKKTATCDLHAAATTNGGPK